MDPETVDVQMDLDEAFENIVVIEPAASSLDNDWMPGEFDTT